MTHESMTSRMPDPARATRERFDELEARVSALELHTHTDTAFPPSFERARAAEARELQATFDLRWDADMRAIKRWQEAHPGSGLIWPDHADLVIWLLEQLEEKGTTHPTKPDQL